MFVSTDQSLRDSGINIVPFVNQTSALELRHNIKSNDPFAIRHMTKLSGGEQRILLIVLCCACNMICTSIQCCSLKIYYVSLSHSEKEVGKDSV